MKKAIICATLIFMTLFVTGTAFAAGGKVRGEKGQGQVEQIKVRNTDEGIFIF